MARVSPPGRRCDAYYDPACLGTATMPFVRSAYVLDAEGRREYVNTVTAFVDGSTVRRAHACTITRAWKHGGVGTRGCTPAV